MPSEMRRRETSYTLLVAVLALAGLGGYGAYVLYPRFNLRAVDAVGLASLSIAAGTAAFFSPCSFPLLATLLIREARGGEGSIVPRGTLTRALSYAAALSLGATVFIALRIC